MKVHDRHRTERKQRTNGQIETPSDHDEGDARRYDASHRDLTKDLRKVGKTEESRNGASNGKDDKQEDRAQEPSSI
ncbi:hypothetical protein ACWAT4_07310 [Bradyrhizobium manausense]